MCDGASRRAVLLLKGRIKMNLAFLFLHSLLSLVHAEDSLVSNSETQQRDNALNQVLVSVQQMLDLPHTSFPATGQDSRAPALDVPWYSSASRDEDGTAREVLEVTSVQKDEKFRYGAGVRKWISLAVGSTTYVVGMRPNGITLLTASFTFPDVGSGQIYSLNEIKFDTQEAVMAATVFKYWNAQTKTMEAILIVALNTPSGVLQWYRLGRSGLESMQTWSVYKIVFNLQVFQVGDQYKLLLVTQCDKAPQNLNCKANVDIFDFNLSSFDLKLFGTFSLDGIPTSVEFGAVGDEQYLAMALPDVGLVKLYQYRKAMGLQSQRNATFGSFEFWKNIESPHVTHAIFFHVSYKMYLAVGGLKPTILRFVSPTHTEVCPSALQNLGTVFAWMVLPVQTYRDEVVLLAEVAVTDGFAERTVLTLTWGGEGGFRLQPHPPCQGAAEYGSCLLENGNAIGLNGAVALELGDASVVTILIPRSLKPSVLFRLYTQLKPILNPLLREYSALNQAQRVLQMELNNQDQMISETEWMLKHTLSIEGSNLVTGNWVIGEANTPEFETDGADIDATGVTFDDLLVSFSSLIVETKDLLNFSSHAVVFDGNTLHLSEPHILLGGVEIFKKVVVDELNVTHLNGQLTSSLLKDAVRTDQLSKIGGTKTLYEVEAIDIDFATVNDISKDELIFDVPHRPIIVDGRVVFNELLHVAGDVNLPPLGTVNHIDFSEAVFQPGKSFAGRARIKHVTIEGDLTVNVVNTIEMHPYSLRTIVMGKDWLSGNGIQYDNLQVTGNLQVEWVNGYLWNDLVKRIVWKDASDYIDGLTVVDGTIRSENITVWQLNNLAFPEDYVLRTSSVEYIRGKKELHGQLLVGDVAIENTVDGVPLKSLVTLSTNQDLNGVLKLIRVDIQDDVKVDWGINGISFDQINSKSPFIDEGLPVSSNVDFSELEVEGHILVSNIAEGLTLKDYLEDIIVLPQKEDDFVEFRSPKILRAGLASGNSGIKIVSGFIGNAELAHFARVDAPQIFFGVTAVERASFKDFHLSGSWDDIDIIELNADTIRLTGNQESSAWLAFSGTSEMWASQLLILEHLNNLLPRAAIVKQNGNICDLLNSSDDIGCVVDGPVLANHISVSGKLIIHEQLHQICGWNLHNFDARRLSRSRAQTVEGLLSFGNIHIRNHIEIDVINNVLVGSIASNFPKTSFDMKPMLKTGNFAVDDFVVDGTIETEHGVNMLNITYISQMAVKLNGDNTFSESLIFDNIVSASNLEVKDRYSRLQLASLIQDTVLKQDLSSVKVSGEKIFIAGFNVKGAIFAHQLTGLLPHKIITKSSPLHLEGTLRIEGNVHGENLDVHGLLNKLPISFFQNRYKLLGGGRHILQGPARFSRGASVEELYVMGRINDVLFGEFLNSIVMKTESTRVIGNKIFINKVMFRNIAVDGHVKGVKLLDFAHDVIVSDDKNEVTVDGRITFVKKLTATSGVAVSESLDAMQLDGCLVNEWFDNAVYLNGVSPIGGIKKFSNISAHSDLSLSALNVIDLTKIITLHQPQDIPTGMYIPFVGVQRNLDVHGLVNGVHLPSELHNTLMNKDNQHVTGPKTFLGGMAVNASVLSTGHISGKNLTNSVTLDSVQTVRGPLKFQSVVIDGNLHVDGLISNVDVKKWKEQAFLLRSSHPRLISGEWRVLGQTRFMKEVGGNSYLDGENVRDLALEVERIHKSALDIHNGIRADWKDLCQGTNALLEMARAQPYLFKQLEVIQVLPTPLIWSMHAFEARQQQLLVVSFAHNCSGAVYQWDSQHTSWTLVEFAMQNVGGVERWKSLQSGNNTYLLSSSKRGLSCPYHGGNVWRFGPGLQLRNVHTMEAWHDAEVDEVQGFFYTLNENGLQEWQIQDGGVVLLRFWPHSVPDARFVPQTIGSGLSLSDGKFLHVFARAQKNSVQLSNTLLPARDEGSVAVMKVSNGRQLTAVALKDSDLIMVYEDIVAGRELGTVRAHRAHSLSVLELAAPGRNGQTLLAFIEDERLLRVVEYRGLEGFVPVAEAKLPVSVKEMIPVRLQARGLVNQRYFLLLRSDYKVLLLELEMTGDPLDEPSPRCDL